MVTKTEAIRASAASALTITIVYALMHTTGAGPVGTGAAIAVSVYALGYWGMTGDKR